MNREERSSQTDKELARLAVEGEASAFEEIHRRYRRSVYALVLRMTRNAADAEDLTQESFLAVLRSLGSFRGEAAFSSWLYRLAVNAVRMHFRRRSSRPEDLTSDGEICECKLGVARRAATPSVFDRIAIDRALKALPPGYRAAFVLHDVEGFEHAEIARMRGCATGTSKSQLHNARVSLALEGNRPMRNARLDVENFDDRLAELRTKRLPSFKVTTLISQPLTPFEIHFEKGAFGTFPETGPIPEEDTTISSSMRPTALVTGQITQPLSQLHRIIEEQMAANTKVTKIESISRTGIAVVYVELDENLKETGKEFDDIKLKLDSIHNLPQGAGPINFVKDFGDTAALMLTVAGPPLSEEELEPRARELQKAIERERAGAADGGRRFTLVFNLPQPVASHLLREPAAMFLGFVREKGFRSEKTLKLIPQVSKVSRSGLINESIFLFYSQEHLSAYGIQPAQLGELQNLYVYSSQGQQKVPLRQVSQAEYGMQVEKVRSRNQFRTITVSTTPTAGHLASEIMSASRKQLKELEASLPAGYLLEIGGEQEDQVEGFADLTMVLGISVVLIFIALVFQFKNAVKPFIVFAAVPYGMVGALAALWVMGAPFGFMAFLGIVSLVGVIISHIIVLFDFIEEKHAEGEPLVEALLDAGIMRLRPVLITVGATVIALFPLASHGGPLWEPMCYAQIGGLCAATFITLLLVPVFYGIFVLDLKLVKWETAEESQTVSIVEQHA